MPLTRLFTAALPAVLLMACNSEPPTANGGWSATGAKSDGLPAFAPVYPGAEVKTRLSGPDGDAAQGGLVVLSTPDPLPKVVAFYDRQAKAAGVAAAMIATEADSAVRLYGDSGTVSGAMVAMSTRTDAPGTEIVITAGSAGAAAAAMPAQARELPRLQ